MTSEDYDLQELLSLIEVTDSEKSPDLFIEETSKISQFIREYKIHSGLDRIPTCVVYYTYKEKFGGDLSKVEFFREFKKEFTQRRTGKQRVYMLVSDSFDMSRDGLLQAQFHNGNSKK